MNFGYVNFGEDGESLLVVMAGVFDVAQGVVCAGQACVGAGLLVTVAGVAGDGVGRGVVGDRIVGVPGCMRGLAGAVERP